MPELIALGLSHKTAPLELREQLALTEGRAAGVMTELTGHPSISEATVFSTCNRTEVYLYAPEPVEAESVALSVLSRQAEIRPTELTPRLYSLRDREAARHLFRVTAGLDSMIVGEAEIQGQVKRAHELALVEGASGPVLSRLFHGAVAAGGRSRSETGIGEKGVSVSSVSVESAARTLGDLSRRRALVVGAGETAGQVAGALENHGAETVYIANRHFDRARELAGRFGGEAVRMDRLQKQLEAADLVISATNSPHHLIDPEMLEPVMEARAGRPMLLVDLAVPRDIDPGVRGIAGVSVSDIEDIQAVVERNAGSREAEAVGAMRILDSEVDRFERWQASLEVLPTVVALREAADEVARRVLAENEARWQGLTGEDRERLETVARTIVSRMLHHPTASLKQSAGSDDAYRKVNVLQELFGLDPETAQEGGGEATVIPMRPEEREQ
ncbi:MAG: glutamyl-tRNA reductase [Thermoleophilia bacterium]|nr:glutamyl-tRNA reductase [Thermoleophilia bacterium]